jgi:hypothetical protein
MTPRGHKRVQSFISPIPEPPTPRGFNIGHCTRLYGSGRHIVAGPGIFPRGTPSCGKTATAENTVWLHHSSSGDALSQGRFAVLAPSDCDARGDRGAGSSTAPLKEVVVRPPPSH